MAGLDEVHSRTICPFLGTLDEEGKPAPCVDYPSFENACFVADQPEAVMLTDQATFCLSSGHRHCPRLTSIGGSSLGGSTQHAAETPSADHSDPLLHAIAEMEAALEARHTSRTRRRRRWGWFGAAMLFVSSLLCGGLFAAYIGWQLVNTDVVTTQAGTVTTLANAAGSPVGPAPPPVYLIVTATSDPAPRSGPTASPVQRQSLEFPPAVTATPAFASPGYANALQSAQAAMNQAVTTPIQSVPPRPEGSRRVPATPSFSLLSQVPTRRPTPMMDLAITIPTVSQATPAPSPSPSPSSTPTLGPPVVIFAAEDAVLESGDCTTVSWNVENVRAVYYENLGVDGQGEQEECIRDKPGDYTLTVVLPNGSTKYYTVTVGLILPTETPTPTSTFPPEVIPTATWTPVIPTDTPTPDMQYGALLTVKGGSEQTCVPGKTCEIDLLITNTSLAIDNISLLFLGSPLGAGPWNARFCRMDGVCSDSKLTLASVGPSNTALVSLLVDVPKRGGGKTVSYIVRAVSEGSGATAGSDAVTIEITGE